MANIFQMGTALLMNLTVIISAFLFAGRLLKISQPVEFFISLFVLYFSQIVISELALGMLGILYLRNVLLLNLALCLIICLAAKRRRPDFSLRGKWGNIPLLISDRPALFLLAIICVFGLTKSLINLMNPPFGWDSLNYHFTFPAEWLKHGNLSIPITINDDPSPSYFPINGSLFYLWLMLPLRNVFLADLGQLPFFMLCFLSVFGIARKIGLGKASAFYAAGLFFLIPNFFKQLSIAYVDVMVAGLFLTSVLYLFLLHREFSLRYVVLFGISLGLLLGTKTVALPYACLLFLPFAALCLRNPRRIRLILPFALAVVLCGGYTYIRNILEAGNPLYPLEYKLFGRAVLNGVIDKVTYAAHFLPGAYRLDKILFHEGLGAQTLIFVLPAAFLALPLAIFKKRKPDFILAYFLALPLLIFCVYRFIIPLANLRYIYPLLGIGMISGFYAAEALRIPGKAIKILVVACGLVSMSELAKRMELVSSIILTFALFSLLLVMPKKLSLMRAFLNPAVKLLIFLTFFALLILSENWYLQNEFPRYLIMKKYSGFWPDAAKAWEWLNVHTQGNNIAYVGRPVAFPLYGTNLKNNVYYVSVNTTEPAKLHYFPRSRYRWGFDFLSQHKNLEANGNYRGGADYSVWLKNLTRRGTDYLFVYSLHQTKEIAFPLEDGWAKSHPEKFRLKFENPTVHIYRVAQ